MKTSKRMQASDVVSTEEKEEILDVLKTCVSVVSNIVARLNLTDALEQFEEMYHGKL